MKRVAALATSLSVLLAPQAHAYHVDPGYARERTALAVVHPDGRVSISPEGEEPRPALSLAKLYLGYWVLYNGTAEEQVKVQEMVETSDDAIATSLDRAHPKAIDEIAKDFELEQTRRGSSWGKTETSARDLATFVNAILWDPVAKPLLAGMEHQAEVAKDGFIQGFGTARLQRVTGSKMGWSDNRKSATGSVSYGEIGEETWTAASLTYGTAYENTVDTHMGINQVEESQQARSLHPALGDGFLPGWK